MSDLNDSLDDLLSGDFVPAPELGRKQPPAHFSSTKTFEEGCKKCGGTGQFRGFSGRVLGDCFACKGAGKKTFKSSPETRAKARQGAADRKARTAQESLEAFEHEHPAVWAWIKANAGKFDFATKMVEAIVKFGSLTPGQLAACQRCVDREVQKANERAARQAEAPAVDTTKLETAFAKARAFAERKGQVGVWLKPISMKSGDVVVKFTQGSPGSQWEHMIFAKTDGGKKLGHVKDGKFVRKFVCEDTEAAAVMDCLADPAKAATTFGKAFGICSVCHRTLTQDESIGRAMGPICAEKFGWA